MPVNEYGFRELQGYLLSLLVFQSDPCLKNVVPHGRVFGKECVPNGLNPEHLSLLPTLHSALLFDRRRLPSVESECHQMPKYNHEEQKMDEGRSQ